MKSDLTTIEKAPRAKRAPLVRPTRNGIEHPGVDGECARAWSLLNMLLSDDALTLENALAYGHELGLNEGNVRTELSRFRRYYGLQASQQAA